MKKQALKKKINIDNMTEEELQKAEQQLIEKISPIVKKAADQADKILAPYGLSAKMAFEVIQKQ
jgi:hypothetical protein